MQRGSTFQKLISPRLYRLDYGGSLVPYFQILSFFFIAGNFFNFYTSRVGRFLRRFSSKLLFGFILHFVDWRLASNPNTWKDANAKNLVFMTCNTRACSNHRMYLSYLNNRQL